jgi:protein TonB
MFEQAVLSQRPSASRYWAAAIGITGELLFVAGIFLVPLIWPQLLPRAATLTWILLPTPPPAVKTPSPAHVRPVARPWQMLAGKLIQPIAVPERVTIIEDAPSAGQAPGVDGGVATADLARLAIGVLNQVIRPAAPPRAAEPAVSQPPKSAATEPLRYKVGGLVHMARLVHRVDPVYPSIARQARISGAVELTGVIGSDGHIRELRVVKGHPFLAHAALEAVRQWVYEPTLLNGEAVEVIAPFTVNFLLN